MANNEGTFAFKMIPASGDPAAALDITIKATGVSFTEALKASGREYNKKLQYSLNDEPVAHGDFDKTHVKPGDTLKVTEKARGS